MKESSRPASEESINPFTFSERSSGEFIIKMIMPLTRETIHATLMKKRKTLLELLHDGSGRFLDASDHFQRFRIVHEI